MFLTAIERYRDNRTALPPVDFLFSLVLILDGLM